MIKSYFFLLLSIEYKQKFNVCFIIAMIDFIRKNIFLVIFLVLFFFFFYFRISNLKGNKNSNRFVCVSIIFKTRVFHPFLVFSKSFAKLPCFMYGYREVKSFIDIEAAL